MQIAFAARDETAIEITTSAVAGGTVSFEWQYATRPDFQFCIAPLIGSAAEARVRFATLNRAQTYFWRGREVFGNGASAGWSNTVAVATAIGNDTPYLPGVEIQPAMIVVPEQPVRWEPWLNTGSTSFPASNLGRPSPTAAYRGGYANTGTAGFWIEHGGAPIDTIALLETNLPDGATIRVVGSNAQEVVDGRTGGDALVTDWQTFRSSANLRGRRGYHGMVRLPSPVSYRFWRVEVAGAGPPANLAHITHAVFGRARVIKNYAEFSDQPLDLSTLERQRDGSPDAVAGFRMRRVDFSLSMMRQAEHEAAFADLSQLVGSSDPVFIVPNSKAGPYLHDRLLYGNLVTNRGSNTNMRFERQLSIESIINP